MRDRLIEVVSRFHVEEPIDLADFLLANGVVVKSMAKKELAEYRQYLRDRAAGRILTKDGLRLICEACENDPEKIGRHFLEVLYNEV